MKNIMVTIAVSICFLANAQSTYTELTQEAIQIVQKRDSIHYEHALNLLEKAFENSPDSINGTGLYYASLIASDLKLIDKAFSYLKPLAKMEKDEEGYPGWSFVLDKYAKEDYKNLLKDKSWKELERQAQKDSLDFFKKLQSEEQEFYSVSNSDIHKASSSRELYQVIKNSAPYLSKKKRTYSISLNVSDSMETSFLIHLPENYSPEKKYPLLFFLHGAVRFSEFEEYQIPERNLGGWNRYYTKYSDLNDVILVFPSANKEYNWMLQDKGFFMIPKITKLVKKAININDNKIFISGHSNGATGSFSYLMKQPTQFAGFYGFNTYPKVFTGGTFVENIKNRSFINFSTDKDYYYPENANDDFTNLMNQINADYKEYRYKGFPHWFPEFDESEPAYEKLFEDLKTRKRNPFPKKISWEFDDNNYGNIDWISDITLDTLGARANWHKELNFKITKWLEYDKLDSLVTISIDKNAFDFPRKSGKVRAEYQSNVFRIETSGIKSLRINISPEMINLKRKVKIYVDDKLKFNKKVRYNREFMLQNFETTRDREQIWINSIKLEL